MEQTRAQKAKTYFLSGYNCAQAVALAFCDLTGYSEAETARLTSGFGGGVGRLREVCGTVTGLTFVMSALYGYDNPQDNEAKALLYAEIQKLAGQFEAKNGSVVCRELLGLSQKETPSPTPSARTAQFYKKRPCAELVEMSAGLLEDYIQQRH